MAWKANIRVIELDPNVMSISLDILDIDGQTMLYQHRPVTPFAVTWPGPRVARMSS